MLKEWNFHLHKGAELQRNVAAHLELNNTRLLQCARLPKHLDFPRSAASEIVLPTFFFFFFLLLLSITNKNYIYLRCTTESKN